VVAVSVKAVLSVSGHGGDVKVPTVWQPTAHAHTGQQPQTQHLDKACLRECSTMLISLHEGCLAHTAVP
jgi:hypothetical protein